MRDSVCVCAQVLDHSHCLQSRLRSYQIIVEKNSLGMLERLKPSFRAFITFTFVKESQAREATDERTFIDKKYGVNRKKKKSVSHEMEFERANISVLDKWQNYMLKAMLELKYRFKGVQDFMCRTLLSRIKLERTHVAQNYSGHNSKELLLHNVSNWWHCCCS